MCDTDNLNEWNARGGFDWAVNRRQFAALGAAGAISACAPRAGGGGGGMDERDVSIATQDGTMDAFYVAPGSGRYPGVIMWTDIAGLREAFRVMARRLAGQGYAVIVPNPYYRDTKAPQFADFAAFKSENGFEKVTPWRNKLTADSIGRDAKVLVGWLDEQPQVDTAKPIGSNGYCMGGPFTVFCAAAVPDRVRAAASLHGAGLVDADDPKSPYKLIGDTKASFLFGIAQNDDAKQPQAKDKLREAAEAAGRPAEVEVYPADHGWCVIDSQAYDKEAAERAWGRMSALFDTTLKG